MLPTPNTKDASSTGAQSILSKLLSENDLMAFKKNLEDLGEESTDYFKFDEKLEEEAMPKKHIVIETKTSKEHHIKKTPLDKTHHSKSLAKTQPVTMFDIVNDRKSGQPTASEVQFFYNRPKKLSSKGAQLLTRKRRPLELTTSKKTSPKFL